MKKNFAYLVQQICIKKSNKFMENYLFNNEEDAIQMMLELAQKDLDVLKSEKTLLQYDNDVISYEEYKDLNVYEAYNDMYKIDENTNITQEKEDLYERLRLFDKEYEFIAPGYQMASRIFKVPVEHINF